KVNMTLFAPDELTPEHMISFGSQTYGAELLITGVPTNSQGEPSWATLDDLLATPHAHGMLACIETISHVHQWVSMTAGELVSPFPRLKVRFAATIDEAIDGKATTVNPAAWVHLGHGCLEHGFEVVEGLEPWEDEEIESIPGLSNGHEDEDYRSVTDIAQRIAHQQGNILFMALPLCYAQQIAAKLCQNNRIHLASASTDFRVNDTLQFYDGATHGERMDQSLSSWSQWVRAVEGAWRGAARILFKNGDPSG
ncbi:MAG: hypothetical protein ACPHFV_02580, partial [Poseidonia sp.]